MRTVCVRGDLLRFTSHSRCWQEHDEELLFPFRAAEANCLPTDEQRAEIQSRRSRRIALFFAQRRASESCSPLESSSTPACELDEATGETDVGRVEHAARTAPVHGTSDSQAVATCLMVAPRRNPIDSRDLLRLLLPEIVRAATARLRRVTQTSGHQICKPATLRSRRWAEAMAGAAHDVGTAPGRRVRCVPGAADRTATNIGVAVE